MAEYYAHSGRNAIHRNDFQPLAAHLRGVAAGAAGVSLPGLAAAAADWRHDLGKYRPAFQEYVRGDGGRANGDPETHHKQAGAAVAWAAKKYPVALVVDGLRNGSELTDLVENPAGQPVAEAVRPIAVPENDTLRAGLPPPQFDHPFHADLFTRVLFGCLVDAGWADTAAHDRRCQGLPDDPLPPPPLNPDRRLGNVFEFIRPKAETQAGTPLGKARRAVLDACLAAAERPQAVFSLTVPTGGGKTLAALAFALKHTARHGLRRVIYVDPYMTMLEQNAGVIRDALGLGPDAPDVFTHYSLAEPGTPSPPVDPTEVQTTDPDSAARRAENWDAPLVVATNVQFSESLFSNKPEWCRNQNTEEYFQ